jgi:serine protease Do
MRTARWSSGSIAVIIGNSSGLSGAISLSTLAGRRGGNRFWQLGTPASPGLSGAPVFDSNGDLGGLLVGEVGGRVGEYPGRPLPALMVSSDSLKAAINRYIRHSPTSGRPWLGISVRPSLQSNGSVRVYVDSVVANSPAQTAGIQPGDVLVRIDNSSIQYVSDLADWVHNSRPGHNATLSVVRQGEPRAVAVTVGRR